MIHMNCAFMTLTKDDSLLWVNMANNRKAWQTLSEILPLEFHKKFWTGINYLKRFLGFPRLKPMPSQKELGRQ
jgi:hypothetical protein